VTKGKIKRAPACASRGAFLRDTVVRKCPECGAEIELLAGDTMDGEIVNCPECDFELEVVFDPSQINLEQIAKGDKTTKPYDVSKLNLEVAPTFIPAPGEGEDWGE